MDDQIEGDVCALCACFTFYVVLAFLAGRSFAQTSRDGIREYNS